MNARLLLLLLGLAAAALTAWAAREPASPSTAHRPGPPPAAASKRPAAPPPAPATRAPRPHNAPPALRPLPWPPLTPSVAAADESRDRPAEDPFAAVFAAETHGALDDATQNEVAALLEEIETELLRREQECLFGPGCVSITDDADAKRRCQPREPPFPDAGEAGSERE